MSNFIVNSFQIPNAVIDELMANLSGAELKCYLLIARKTTGWQKVEDAISISQFQEKTGLSNRAVIDSCKKLEVLGLIQSKKGYRGMNVFSCRNMTCEKKSHVKKTTSTCEESSQDPMKKVHTQNNTIQNTLIQNTLCDKPHDKKKNDFDNSAFEKFYNAGLPKVGKPKAMASFKSAYKNWKAENKTQELFAKFLIDDIQKRLRARVFGFDKLHPATYLNQARWEDDVIAQPLNNQLARPNQLTEQERIEQKARIDQKVIENLNKSRGGYGNF